MQQDQSSKMLRLYSQKAIGIATYIGGPLAAGILIRRNFINLGSENLGKTSLIISVIFSTLIFSVIFYIPENIINKIPNLLVPAIYVLITYLLVHHYQGSKLKIHEEEKGAFYSGWKAAGIGFICFFITVVYIFLFALFSPEDPSTAEFNAGLTEFQSNEEIALRLYSLSDSEDTQNVVNFIVNEGIPAWERNAEILNELEQVENLYIEQQNYIKKLKEYTSFRIESYQLIEKSILQNTRLYDSRIIEINEGIEDILINL